MVGYCELELRLGNEEKRAPPSAYTTEVFNLLQSLSNLKYETTGGVMRALTPEEIGLAVEQAHEKDLKYATIRRLFSIPSR